MPTQTILEKVKDALRISAQTTVFDAELNGLISAARLDLGLAGVDIPTNEGALVERAIITYCRVNFGQPDDYDRLKRSYDEQKAQLATATGFTNWQPWVSGGG